MSFFPLSPATSASIFIFLLFIPFDWPPTKNGLLRDRPPPQRGIRRRRVEALLLLLLFRSTPWHRRRRLLPREVALPPSFFAAPAGLPRRRRGRGREARAVFPRAQEPAPRSEHRGRRCRKGGREGARDRRGIGSGVVALVSLLLARRRRRRCGAGWPRPRAPPRSSIIARCPGRRRLLFASWQIQEKQQRRRG